MNTVVEWDKNGWHSTREDGYRLTYGVSVMVASHPDMRSRCLIIVIGPLSVAFPWFSKRGL